jgi:acylphosphatase
MATEIVRKHVFVSGQVQGVFFRDSTREMAVDNKVAGWVRNLGDGRVEAVFEGPAAAVDRLIQWCHSGPPRAKVHGVMVLVEEAIGEAGFRSK